MATATRPGPFARKPTDVLVREASGDSEHGLKRSVGVLDLTALGIGAVIGTGIFVIIGEGIGEAGPSIIISFALAGVTCLFSAFSYAELVSSIPSRAAPTPTATRRSASSWRGSSAGT